MRRSRGKASLHIGRTAPSDVLFNGNGFVLGWRSLKLTKPLLPSILCIIEATYLELQYKVDTGISTDGGTM